MHKLIKAEDNSNTISFKLAAAHSLNITWDLPEYFYFPHSEHYSLQSSSFAFANATWCLRLYPNQEDDETFVSLVRLRSLVREHRIVSSFDMLWSNGEYVYVKDEQDKAEHRKLTYCGYDLEQKYCVGGERSSTKDTYIPDRNLRLVCHLLCEEDTGNGLLKKCETDCRNISEQEEEQLYSSFLSLKPSTAQSIRIMWTIPDYFSLPGNFGYSINSPPFDFGYATWLLKLYPNGMEKDSFDGAESTIISLVRLHSLVALFHEIVYAFEIVKINEVCPDDSKYSKFSVSENREFPDIHLGFNDTGRSDLLADRPNIAPDGKVTFSAHFFCEESTLADAVVRKMSHELDSYRAHGRILKNLFLNGKDSDLTLKVNGKEFRVHRNILSAHSRTFECMLAHDMNENKDGVVHIPDCDPQAMEHFLLYAYSGEGGTPNENNILGLCYIAYKYDIAHLKEECRVFIQNSLSTSTFCDIVQLAMTLRNEKLLQCSIEIFAKNSRKILASSQWESFKGKNEDVANDFLNKVG